MSVDRRAFTLYSRLGASMSGANSGVQAMIRKTILALVAAGVVLGASACNTVKGLGRDIESVGEAGDRAVK